MRTRIGISRGRLEAYRLDAYRPDPALPRSERIFQLVAAGAKSMRQIAEAERVPISLVDTMVDAWRREGRLEAVDAVQVCATCAVAVTAQRAGAPAVQTAAHSTCDSCALAQWASEHPRH